MINLFEYQNKEKLEFPADELEGFLDDIWKNRERSSYFRSDESREESQRFIQFLRKTGEVKSRNYAGIILCNDVKINLLPKIFYGKNINYDNENITAIYNHILWWLSYCKKIKFPNYQTAMHESSGDFLEILIYLFSTYTRDLLSSSLFMQYQEVDEELSFVKGRIQTGEYIRNNISTGRWHRLQCCYDSFVSDNTFNRIIKYVSRLLLSVTTRKDTQKKLREILFILDEVSDIPVTAQMCSGIMFNPMFRDFEIVRDYCYLFLRHSISLNYKNSLKLFAFLLPMDYLFEDFIRGFLEKEISAVTINSQITGTKLDRQNTFTLKPDLLIRCGNHTCIADTKYKLIYSEPNDPTHGVSQSDLYQMTAYAVRFNISDIILLYPDTITTNSSISGSFIIDDAFAGGKEIRIRVFQLPVIHRQLFSKDSDKSNDQTLSALFEPVKKRLADTILQIFHSMSCPSVSRGGS